MESIQCLIFDLIGCRFGTDMEQVTEIIDPEQADRRSIKLYQPETLIAPYRAAECGQAGCKVMVLRYDIHPVGIVIQELRDIAEVAIERIRPLPPLIRACHRRSPVWAVAWIGDQPTFLADFLSVVR